jgi:limonene-1,2-epoxide hydrolase
MPSSRIFATLLGASALFAAAGAAAETRTEHEAANAALVRAFLNEASTRLDHLRRFLAEDAVFQYEAARIAGRDALIAQTAQKMQAVASYGVDVGRIAVVGDTVLNERFDNATMKDGQKVRLQVTSVFLIRDGKIAEWREYPQPAAQ